MSSISGISSSSTWSIIQSARQKAAEDLFSQLDTSSQGYIDKSTLATALDSTSSSDVDELFSKLDVNGDGKVTKQEFTDTLQQLESQLQANENLQSGSTPPTPPEDDAGFTKEELTAQLDEIGTSDSKRSSLISNVIANFDEADTNGDGKVSFQEAKTLEQSSSTTSSTSTSSDSTTTSTTTSSTSSTESAAKILQQIMTLLKAYDTEDSNTSSKISLLA